MEIKTGIICSLPVVLLICTACSDAFALRKAENEELVSALARLDKALGEMISRTDGQIPYKRNEGTPRRQTSADGPVPYKRFYDGDVPYKRDDGLMPYKRGASHPKYSTEDFDLPYRRDASQKADIKRQDYGDDPDILYRKETSQNGQALSKRGWLWNKPKQNPNYDDLDEDNPYKRQYDYSDGDDVLYRRLASKKGLGEIKIKRQGDYGDGENIVYKRLASKKGLGEFKNKRQGDYGDGENIVYKRLASKKDESLDRVLRYLLDMEERLHERSTEKRDHDDQ